MPTPSTEQSTMPLYHGKAPMVDSNGILANFSWSPRVVAKTAAYTCVAKDSGTYFTTTGATAAVTFTLPAINTGPWIMYFINTVDLDMTVASAAVDTINTFNDVAADSVAFSTSGEKIGGACVAVCDGTTLSVLQMGVGGHRQTMTIAT